jgi:hypothetical protein
VGTADVARTAAQASNRSAGSVPLRSVPAVTAPYKSGATYSRPAQAPMRVARRLKVWVNPHPGEIRQRRDALHSAIDWPAPVRSSKSQLLKSMIKGNLASAASWPAPLHGSRIVRVDIFIAVRAGQSYPQRTSSDFWRRLFWSAGRPVVLPTHKGARSDRAPATRASPCVFCAHVPSASSLRYRSISCTSYRSCVPSG